MKFRMHALGLHLLASCAVLSTVLGTLYFGWYRWPGWYLADATTVVAVLTGVDLVVGPLLTFVVASPKKSRRELSRDITMIGVIQLCALIYGSGSLWNGRPLYYAYSEDVLQLVQAYDIGAQELAIGQKGNPSLAPHWYSRPRWIWAPLPVDPKEHDEIVQSAIRGGDDVISMPRYYQPWESGLPTLRRQLRKVADIKYFSGNAKNLLAQRMREAGIATNLPNAMALTGRGRPLLAVFDLATLNMKAIFKVG